MNKLSPSDVAAMIAMFSKIIRDLPEDDVLAIKANPEKLKRMLTNFAAQVESDKKLEEFPHDECHMLECHPYRDALYSAKDFGDFSELDRFGVDTLRSLLLDCFTVYLNYYNYD